MSTLSHFPDVRRRRAERRDMRRGMQADLRTIEGLIARGKKQPKTETNVAILVQLGVKRTVMRLMISHIETICRDPKRSGASKDKILAGLGVANVPESTESEAPSLVLAAGEQASTPL